VSHVWRDSDHPCTVLCARLARQCRAARAVDAIG
jgi:hypothetical protein